MKTKFIIPITVVSSLILQYSALAQGGLLPSAPPGATMLTLTQVEPRTPVDAVHTPGDGLNEYLITQPGSYYLTANIIGVSGKQGINIQTNNVTLDLRGFSVIGVPGSLSGIDVFSANVVVCNGMVTGWGQNGIYSGGINVTLEGLTVCSNSLYGIQIAGANSSVIGNNVIGNDVSDYSGYAGIYAQGSNNLIQNNHVFGTVGGTAAFGIVALGTGDIVIQNIVDGNGAYSIEWNPTSVIVGPVINSTTSGIVTNSNPWGNLEF